jgi:Icc protein
MRIIQITDLHIGVPLENTFGIDVRTNFLNTLEAIMSPHFPDLVVITGDLCFREPRRDILHWIGQQLEEKAFPYQIVTGNHDDSKMVAEMFDLEFNALTQEIYYAKEFGGWPCIFLDTAKGKMSDEQYGWLEQILTGLIRRPVIFMHHPPAFCGVPFMDGKHAFREMEKIQNLFAGYSFPIEVFCGHYHVEKTISFRDVHIHITPSCFFQIDQDSPDFQIDHDMIGYRIIDLEDEKLLHHVCYLDGAKLP